MHPQRSWPFLAAAPAQVSAIVVRPRITHDVHVLVGVRADPCGFAQTSNLTLSEPSFGLTANHEYTLTSACAAHR